MYHSLLSHSQYKSCPVVLRMSGKFVDIKTLPHLLQFLNRKINTAGEKVSFRDNIKWLKIDEFGSYKYRHSFDNNEEWKVVNIRRLQTSTNIPIIADLEHKPQTAKKIKQNKINDIEKQLPYIPTVHQEFYKKIIWENRSRCTNDLEQAETDDELEDAPLSADLESNKNDREDSCTANVRSRRKGNPVTKQPCETTEMVSIRRSSRTKATNAK